MGETYMNGSNMEDGVDDSSEGDEEDEETDDAPARLMHPNPASVPSSASPSSTLTSHRKSYPPTWKASDEMMGVPIPRKARSGSTKRSYDCWTSAGVAGEQSLRQASSSPVASSGVVSPSAASVSPTSSSLSVKKKIANGSKQRPPKSTKSPSTIQEDIEIEVAEVLFGLMRQSQGPSKPEVMPNDSDGYGSREVNTSTDDFKSRATSRISNSSSSAPPFSDTSPKRKKPRLVSQQEENTAVVASHGSPIPTAPKSEAGLQAKPENHLPKLENNSDLPAENGGVQSALLPATGTLSSVEKRSTAADQLQGKDLVTKERIKEVASPEKETLDAAVNYTSIKQITATGDKESCREEKFEIDLMTPPPQSRSSPEGGGDMNYHRKPMAVGGDAVCGSPMLYKVELDLKPSEVEKVALNTGVHPGETQKPNFKNKAKGDTNLHYDSKLSQHLQNQQPLLLLKPSRNDTSTDKTAQPSFLPPLSMPVPAGWPVGVPPFGYVAPQQGAAVSVDGKTMAPTSIQPPHFRFTQPRPVRCATHGYIAKDINIHQKIVNPIWPANIGAAPLFGAPSSNLNVVPAGDLHATAVLRGDVNPDKGQAFAFLPGQQPSGKDKGAQRATNIIVEDGDPKKQFFQSLPHGGPGNMLHGPATFFYPLSQQQVAAASTRANSTKPPVMTAGPVSTSTVTSAPNATAPAGQASPATLSFSYPNMAGNETPCVAILGNGAYQFPIPAHVGAAQAYRGAPTQVMPFFNGSYYPSPILHPSQLQQQQQVPPPQQIHQKPSISTASSSSQKQPQNQLQGSQRSSANGLATNSLLPTFPTLKSRASEMQQHEVGREGSSSTANSCLSCPPNMSVYGQNFTMPFNPANFALLTPPVPVPLSGATVGGATNSNHTEKKEQATQAFALSFASANGAMPAGFDNASKAHHQAMLQSLPEAARNNYHIMTAAAAAQAAPQKMNYHGSEDSKSGAPNSSNVENDRKGTAARASASSVQSISFSRPDLVETSVATVSENNVADTAARSSILAPGSAHSSRSSMPNTNSNSAASNSHQQQQPFIHLQKQQQFAAAATRNKAPVASNGSVYPDHISSASATGAKFTNAVQSSNTQSQWKNPGRTTTQVSSPSISTSITASMKSLGQQHVRPQQGQTHISKVSTALQVQQGSPSPSMMVGSPPASSVFKGHSGSPRMTTSTSVGSKPAQASSVTTQQGKNSPSVPSQKSSPVAGPGRNLQSAFGNPHMTASSSMGSSKPQSQQQPQQLLQQPQLSKQSIQQTQMFFNASYMQTYSTAPGGAAPAAGGFQVQRHQPKQQQQPSKSQGAPTLTVSSGMHLNSTLSNASTNDPVKAVAAASNIKGGAQSQSNLHAAQTSGGTPMVVSSGFTYVHAVPAAAVQVKPAEQKQPAA